MSIITHIFKQKSIGKQWGVFSQVAGQVSIAVGMINMFLLAATAYNTTLSTWLLAIGIRINFWTFLGVILLPILVGCVLVWKFALPSFYSSFNEQFYRHDNLLRKDIEVLKKDNEKMLMILARLEENGSKGE